MQLLSRLTGHGHGARPGGMMELAMTTARPDQKPAVMLNHLDDLSDFHRSRSCRLRRFPALQRVDQTLENQATIVAAKNRFAGPFRMGHQPGHVAAFVADARDVP